MKVSELKAYLSTAKTLAFVKPDGQFIPRHFHITEMGLVTKHSVDCGNTVHNEQTANMQIWVANDYEHRLSPTGLLKIIDISAKVLGGFDPEIEVEYQTDTIGKYGLAIEGENFVLTAKQTDCRAKETCGISEEKPELATTETNTGCCKPGTGCC